MPSHTGTRAAYKAQADNASDTHKGVSANTVPAHDGHERRVGVGAVRFCWEAPRSTAAGKQKAPRGRPRRGFPAHDGPCRAGTAAHGVARAGQHRRPPPEGRGKPPCGPRRRREEVCRCPEAPGARTTLSLYLEPPFILCIGTKCRQRRQRTSSRSGEGYYIVLNPTTNYIASQRLAMHTILLFNLYKYIL